jgi:hypothetical protein
MSCKTLPGKVCAPRVVTKKSTLLGTKMSEKKVSLFFNLRGPHFLTSFATMKNEEARELQLFFDGPHSKEDMIKILQFLSIRGRR